MDIATLRDYFLEECKEDLIAAIQQLNRDKSLYSFITRIVYLARFEIEDNASYTGFGWVLHDIFSELMKNPYRYDLHKGSIPVNALMDGGRMLDRCIEKTYPNEKTPFENRRVINKPPNNTLGQNNTIDDGKASLKYTDI